MRSFDGKRKKKILILTLSVVLALALTVLGCAIYLGDYYRADRPRIDEYVADIGIEQRELSRGTVAFEPEGAQVGLIFYPGGKVETEAYIPLMASLAEKGIVTVLVRMPFNLAVLDFGAAEGICEYFPEIERWYIGGHSLGGAMASFYVSSHAEEFEGLVLLGAYSTSDISETGLRVLSVYGSEDGVMNRKKYEKYSTNLPEDLVEKVIEGGNHAGFGMYGKQDGDGDASISDAEQIKLTADMIWELIQSEKQE